MGDVSKMLAAMAYKGEYRFRLEQIAVPEVGEDDVLIKVTTAGITRGLLSIWQFTDMIKLLPGVIGHELVGVVAQVGSAVSSFQEGERVLVHGAISCGNCDNCRTGRETLCRSAFTIGHAVYGDAVSMPLYERYHYGGMAQYARVPATNLERIPENVTDEVAVNVGTLALGLRALRMAEARFGDVLVITAASGSSGASAVRCAPLFGFTTICGVSTNREGLERLMDPRGLTHSIATAELPRDWEDKKLLTAAILETTGTDGIDAIIDFMPFGCEVTMQSIRSMKPGGCAVLGGGNISELNLPYLELMRNQYQLKGIRGTNRRDEREVMKLLAAGRLEVSDLVTHTFPLTKVNRAVQTVMEREGSPIFVVLKPWM